jgi:hypothetical protein
MLIALAEWLGFINAVFLVLISGNQGTFYTYMTVMTTAMESKFSFLFPPSYRRRHRYKSCAKGEIACCYLLYAYNC